jgi:hypothetical protein
MDFMLANDWLHVINSAQQAKNHETTIPEEDEVRFLFNYFIQK